jgi:AcrR family transcriptional regulator
VRESRTGVPPIRRQNSGGLATRLRLIDVAERMFAESGIGAVSLREIGEAAGQKNTGAAKYHFGDRDGLVAAIIELRLADLDYRRQALLARQADATDRPGIPQLAEALVAPHGAQLKSGILFSGFYARLLLDYPATEYEASRARAHPSTWLGLADRLSTLRQDLAPDDVSWRLEFSAISTFMAFARFIANERAGLKGPRDLDAMEERLTASVSAILGAP